MKNNFINALRYFFYHKHRFSVITKIGPVGFDEYIKILGRENVKVFNYESYKRILWEDVCSLYVIRFSNEGEFLQFEREVWYEYKLPWLTKTILLEVDRTNVKGMRRNHIK
jgi:hypothetical protein